MGDCGLGYVDVFLVRVQCLYGWMTLFVGLPVWFLVIGVLGFIAYEWVGVS